VVSLGVDPRLASQRVEVRKDADCALGRGGTRYVEQFFVDVDAALDALLRLVMEDK
jgi:hypothetical protein